jgi:hypothetical protein
MSCEKMADQHELIWETRDERKQQGLKIDDDYRPLASMPNISNLVFKK